MRLSVECGGFTRAADACRTANQIAALLTESLSSRLADCAGMAGDDAASSGFARAYDDGAREAMLALADLTHSYIGIGRLLTATGLNHAGAEAAAAGLAVSAYVGGSLDDDAFVRVRPVPPPPSLGPQQPSLSRVDAWILDQIEGFVWPGADVARVRSAATAWRRAAASVAGLTDHVDVANDFLARQQSPEVPLALSALGELTTLIGDTAWQLDSLASACEEYAAAVEETHARTRALLAEIAQMVVEGVALSAVVTGVTGGLGGGAAAAVALARVRAYAPRFHALLVALRAGTATATARLRTAQEELVAVRRRAEKFLRVPARTERGEMVLLPGVRTTLGVQERLGGHVIRNHVGVSRSELAARAQRLSGGRASSFPDVATAERCIEEVVTRNKQVIHDWLESGVSQIRLESRVSTVSGVSVDLHGTVQNVQGVRVILRRSPDDPSGFRVHTAFPEP